jgi:predicted Zn-dependent peptidase
MTELSSPVLDLIYDSLFGGYNSPFFIRMSEERGLFYDINGSTERYRNIGNLYFSFEVKEKDVYDAVRISVDILNSFKTTELSEKCSMRAAYTRNAELLYDDARELAFTFGYESHVMRLGYKTVSERKAAYEKLSAEDVRQGACKIFLPENLIVTVKGNKKKIDTFRIREEILRLG